MLTAFYEFRTLSLWIFSHNTAHHACRHPSEPFARGTYTNTVMFMSCCAMRNKVDASDPKSMSSASIFETGRLTSKLEVG